MPQSVYQIVIMFRYRVNNNPIKYVGPPYCRAEMYADRVACCPLVSHGEYAEGETDRRTDARPLHYAFRRMNSPNS